MIIGSCGYGATGSSVLTALLKEYDNIQVFDDFEFTIPYRVDGLQDLEYHLMNRYAKNISGDYALKRFLYSSKCYLTPFINKPCNGKDFYKLAYEYVNNICQLKYRGCDSVDMLSGNIFRNIAAFTSKKIIMPQIIEKITKKRSYIWPCRTMYYSIEPESFYEETRKYIKNLLALMGANFDKQICLDQPFEGNNPVQSFAFFEDPYAIVIDRDPRDLYLEYKYTTHRDGKWFPHGSVDDFIIYYRKMRKNRTDNERVLRLMFEDFLYKYDDTVEKIESFLNLGEHVNPKMYFKPQQSINNTQQIRRFSQEKENIMLIEKELKEYLFPFEDYPYVKFTGDGFYGAGKSIVEAK